METKGITCKIPLDLHNRISEEIRAQNGTMSQFIEQLIHEHYEKGEIKMGKTRTMAFQISEELFQRIKEDLAQYERTYGRRLTQKEFVIGLVESALEEAAEEFDAAEAARREADEECESIEEPEQEDVADASCEADQEDVDEDAEGTEAGEDAENAECAEDADAAASESDKTSGQAEADEEAV